MKRLTLIVTVFLLLIASSSNSATIHVPGDQPTIQAGIDVSLDGDTVLVAHGMYEENINFRGHEILLTSNFLFSDDTIDILNTIIDGSMAAHPDSGSVVMFAMGERSAMINGFTIRNGSGTTNAPNGVVFGGGIACFGDVSPTISNNYIHSNRIERGHNAIGGGIFVFASRLGDFPPPTIISGNRIFDNEAENGGSGILIEFGAASLVGNVIYGNSVSTLVDIIGTVGIKQSIVTIKNNTIANNPINAIAVLNGISTITFEDNILFTDTVDERFVSRAIVNRAGADPEYLSFSNNCIFGTFQEIFTLPPLPGVLDTVTTNVNGTVSDLHLNIYRDPLFCFPHENGYSLTAESPCIGASTGLTDIGAFPFEPCCILPGDINNDTFVDLGDVMTLTNYIIGDGTVSCCCQTLDLDGSGRVDVADIRYLLVFLFGHGPPPVCSSIEGSDCPAFAPQQETGGAF